MRLPHIIENVKEEYITLPALKSFVKANGIPAPKESESSNANKAAYINAVSCFADTSSENQENVLNWIDSVVKEGIKEIQIESVPLKPEMELIFTNELSARRHLESYLVGKNRHLAGNTYGNEYDLVRYDLINNLHGKSIALLFCRSMRYYDAKTGYSGNVEYPIFVDYYYEIGWLIIRYKSRSGLYDLMPEETTLDELLQHSISLNKEIKKINTITARILSFGAIDINIASNLLRTKFYRVLDRYTQTPSEITEVIRKNQSGLKDVTMAIMHICSLPEQFQGKVETDIQNLLEKYISITWIDKSVFFHDREAYPIRLSATDEEESKVDQSSATSNEPLQSKEVFFDNKRMLESQRQCDSLTLIWKRINRTYYSESSFPVRLSEKGGKCTLSFKKYVAEEDILNVLFAIIEA